MKRMPLWGVGPSLIVPALGVASAAAAATWFWPGLFSMWFLPYPILAIVGAVMATAAVSAFVWAGRAVAKAFFERRLVTDGAYAVCRNPLYAAWIILLLPALALLCNSWLMLSAPLVLYISARMRIHHEEEYLQERFGQEYIEYRQRTNAIFPTIRRHRAFVPDYSRTKHESCHSERSEESGMFGHIGDSSLRSE